MGYPQGTKGYLVLNLPDKRFYTSRNVSFRESIFPFKDDETLEITEKSNNNMHEFYNNLFFHHDESNKLEHANYEPNQCKYIDNKQQHKTKTIPHKSGSIEVHTNTSDFINSGNKMQIASSYDKNNLSNNPDSLGIDTTTIPENTQTNDNITSLDNQSIEQAPPVLNSNNMSNILSKSSSSVNEDRENGLNSELVQTEVVQNNHLKTTKSGRVIHKPKAYEDFFLDSDIEYGTNNDRQKYPICNQVSYHRINGGQKQL